MWIDNDLPGLAQTGYEIASEPTDEYNCIAWVVGDNTEWWSHLPGYRWSDQRTPDVESLVQLFIEKGFEVCVNDDLESGYEKIAIYAMDGRWSHAARQLPNGRWASKLGIYEDIEHPTTEGLCGDLYGDVHCTMRRQLTSTNKRSLNMFSTWALYTQRSI